MTHEANPAAGAPDLSALRRDIDRIDAAMHALLIERSAIIDRLIAVKKTAETGSAFRPAREADMMHRLVERHHGILPLDTVESIWRVIISTFTYVQSPYAVHLDLHPGEAVMRDAARFHFGFTVPIHPHETPDSAIAAVAASRGDLALVHAGDLNEDPWWTALTDAAAPKVIARLPFVEREDHPVGTPVYVVSKPVGEGIATACALWAVRCTGTPADIDVAADTLDASGVRLIDAFEEDGATLALVETEGSRAGEDFSIALHAAFGPVDSLDWVGSHARPEPVVDRG
jgi:chorismate mutase